MFVRVYVQPIGSFSLGISAENCWTPTREFLLRVIFSHYPSLSCFHMCIFREKVGKTSFLFSPSYFPSNFPSSFVTIFFYSNSDIEVCEKMIYKNAWLVFKNYPNLDEYFNKIYSVNLSTSAVWVRFRIVLRFSLFDTLWKSVWWFKPCYLWD